MIDWTPDLIARIRELHHQKLGRRKIAKAVGISRDALGPKMTELGMKLTAGFPGAQPWTTEHDDRLRFGWASGELLQSIATALGRTVPSVCARKIELKLPGREAIPRRKSGNALSRAESLDRRRARDAAKRIRLGIMPVVAMPKEVAAAKKRADDRLRAQRNRDAKRATKSNPRVDPAPAVVQPSDRRAVVEVAVVPGTGQVGSVAAAGGSPAPTQRITARPYHLIAAWAAERGIRDNPTHGLPLAQINALRATMGLDRWKILQSGLPSAFSLRYGGIRA